MLKGDTFKTDMLFYSLIFWGEIHSQERGFPQRLANHETINYFFGKGIVKNSLGKQFFVDTSERAISYLNILMKPAFDLSYQKQSFLALRSARRVRYSGIIRLDAMASDYKSPFQSGPASYSRVFLDQTIRIGFIPVKLMTIFSTEHNHISHNINAVGVSFDQQNFQTGLKESLISKMKVEAKRKNRLENSLPMEMKIDARLEELSYILKDTHNLNSRIPDFSLNFSDSLLVDSLRRPETGFDPEFRIRLQQEFDSLTELKHKIKVSALNSDLSVNREVLLFDDPAVFKTALKANGLYKPGYNFLFALRKLEIGNCSPEYGKLILSNTSLMGLNIEYNPKYWYTGVTMGRLIDYSITQPFSNANNFRSATYAFKLGVGQLDQSHIGINIAKFKGATINHTDSQDVQFSQNLYTVQGKYKDNSVIGIEAQYVINKDFKIYSEINASNNSIPYNGADAEVPSNSKSVSKVAGSIFNKSKRRSVLFNSRYEIKSSKTRIFMEYRRVEPFYFSGGAPYLRRDNRKYELRINQGFLRNKLALTFTARNDQDNLSSQKAYTTTNSIYSINGVIRPFSYYFLVATYSQGMQTIKTREESKYFANISMVNLTNGFNYKIAGQQSSTLIGGLFQKYSSDNPLLFKKSVQVSIDQSVVLINKCNMSYNARLLFSLPTSGYDTSNVLVISNYLSFVLLKKIYVNMGYTFTKDASYLTIRGISLRLRYTMNVTGAFELRWDHNSYSYNSRLNQDGYIQNQLFITYSKSF